MEDFIYKMFVEAKKYFIQEEWEKVIKLFTLIIDSSKATPLDKANAYNGRGVAYKKLELYKKAIDDYTKAIDLFTEKNDKAKAYNNRGHAYNQLKQYEKALADYTEAIALYPKDNDKANAYGNRGSTYNELEQYEEAITDYKEAIDLFTEDDDKAKAYYNRGITYEELKQDKKAIADYQKSIDLICQDSSAKYHETDPFYKFCPINKNTLALLIKQEIYFSDIASLNDPLKCPFVQEDQFFRDTVFAEGTDYEPRILSLVLQCNNPKKCEKLPEELRVENYLLFFSHYAEAHKGICIEYQITKEFLQKNMFYKRVSYPETESPESIPDLFAVKNKQWEYEHEARFVAFGTKDLYSYKKDLYFYTEKEVTISKIIFGYKTSNKDKQLLYKIIEGRGIRFLEAQKTGETLLNIDFVEYLPQENQK